MTNSEFKMYLIGAVLMVFITIIIKIGYSADSKKISGLPKFNPPPPPPLKKQPANEKLQTIVTGLTMLELFELNNLINQHFRQLRNQFRNHNNDQS